MWGTVEQVIDNKLYIVLDNNERIIIENISNLDIKENNYIKLENNKIIEVKEYNEKLFNRIKELEKKVLKRKK